MFRRLFKAVFVVLLAASFSSVAWALAPDDALSARPAESVYTVVRVDNLSELFQYIFSPANIEMASSLMGSDVELFAAIASQVPAESSVAVLGISGEGLYVQAAMSMPDSARPTMDRIAAGSAGSGEIFSMLLGENGMMFAEMFAPEVQTGAKGPYYDLMGRVAFAAKENLLLIAFPPTELEASIDALENQENRLALKRRFDSINYLRLYMDMPTTAMFARMFGGEDVRAVTGLFKAPLDVEIGFTPTPASFLVSLGANILESWPDFMRFNEMKPAKGGDMFLAGGGKLFLAAASRLSLDAAAIKANPLLAEGWNSLVRDFYPLTEDIIEGLLNGNITLALGSEATVMGMSVPGGYIALTGRPRAARAVIRTTITNPEAILQADGWDILYGPNPDQVPASVVMGLKGDTLFFGLVEAAALGKAPETTPQLAELLGDTVYGLAAIEFGEIWSWLRQASADPNSILSAFVQEPFKGMMNELLAAELSIPFVKIWSTQLEEAFMEFSIVDVPQENRLLPRVMQLAQMFIR